MTTAIEEITTHLTPEEKQALTEMARVADGTTYVELGSYLGASSCYIAAGMPESARLYCIDTWTNDGMSEGRRDTYDEFLKNTREFSDVIVPLRGTTTARAAAFDGEIDFLFVDAGHDYDNVYADVRDWFPKLKQGALVVFHDTGWAEGVQRVVSEQVRPLALREGTLPNMYWAEIDTGRLPRESSRLRSIYNEEFYHEQKDASYRSAEFIVPIILDVFDVTSVTDVGCGVGGWLHLFQRHGVAEIRGYDVNDLAADRYFVDKRVITTNSDFTSASFRIGANSDLLISLEVAEHLPGEEAERFVSHLTQAAPAIIFSAALCGQSGVNHVNEQPPWYWREKFNRRGFVEIDFIRPLILRNEEICWWYRQNITCFVRSDLLGSNAKLQALWRQHPQIASGHKLTVVNEWVLDRILRGEHLAVVDNAKPLPPFLSVIIPTRNRDALLYSALDSLTRQEYPAERFEVIVVDNGSTDATADVCRHFQRRLPRFKVIHDPRPGLHNGRHTGLREATGEILVYADDDVEAFPSWLEGIAEAFADPQVALVGGKILPKFESPPPEWVAALSTRSDSGWALSWYSVLDLGDTPRDIPAEYVWGCNFSIRKKLLEEIGGFHPDSVPQELIRYRGDGETAVSMRIRELGLKARYHPKASVYHLVSSERMTADYLYRRAFNQGVSDSYASIRRTKSLSRPLPYQGASGTIHETVNRGLVDGFNYHQQMVQADSALQRWVLKEHYLAEEGTIFAEPQLAPTAAAGSVWGPQEP